MMITATKGAKTITKSVSPIFAERTIAQLTAAGYVVANAAPATPVVEAPAAEQTGRVGKGLSVHIMVDGMAKCGADAAYRRGNHGTGNRVAKITGEAVTCRSCQH